MAFYRVRAGSATRVSPGRRRISDFRSSYLEVTMFDVGAGEAISITAPTGQSILVDGGCRRYARLANALASQIQPLSLTAFIASHPHSDHLNAIQRLVEHRPTLLAPRARFYESGEDALRDDGTLQTWWRNLGGALRAANVRRSTVTRLIHPRLLGPRAQLSLYLFAGAYTPLDYRSVFMQMTFGQARFLFAGDSNCDYENLLVDRYGARGLLGAEVLKVTHHGSQNGTSTRLAAAVRPGIAFASTYNDRGHQWETVARDRLPSRCRNFETWARGDITIRTDGGTYYRDPLIEVSTRRPGLLSGALGLPQARGQYAGNQQTSRSQRPDCG